MPIEPIRVLVVEDDDGYALLLDEVLAESLAGPFVSRRAHSLAHALDQLTQGGIDAVVLDLGLPDSWGTGTFRRLHAHAPAVPVVVLTGRGDEAMGVELVEAGAQDYLVKGQELSQLVRALRYAVGRAESEAAVQRSEARFRALIENSSDMIALVQLDGTILYVSPAVIRVFGFTQAELLDRKAFDFIHPDDVGAAGKAVAEMIAQAGTSVTVEYRLRTKAGEWRWVEAVGHNMVGDPAVGAIVINHRDITERKQAETERERLLAAEHASRAAAERAERRLAFLAEASAHLATSLDVETTVKTAARHSVPVLGDWCIVDLFDDAGNVERVAVTHADPEQADLARQLRRHFPADTTGAETYAALFDTGKAHAVVDGTEAHLAAAISANSHLAFLRELRPVSYILVPLQARGRRHGVIMFVMSESARHLGLEDVTLAEELGQRCALAIDNARLYYESQAAEEWVRQQLQFTEAISSSLAEGVYAIALDGRITFVNPAAEKLLGWEAAALLDRPAHETLHRSDMGGSVHAAHDCRMYHALQTGETLRDDDDVFVRRDGTIFPASYVSSPIRAHDGEIVGAVIAFHDTTERKRAEEALRESEQRFRFQAYLLDVVGQAVVATDLDDRIIYWNRFAEGLFGWRADEVLGRDVKEVAPANITGEQVNAIIAAMQAGQSWSGDLVVWRRDGSSFPTLVRYSPVHDVSGSLIGFIGVSVDITERKQAEEALRARAAQQAAVAQLGQRALTALGPDGLMQEAAEIVATTLALEYVAVLELSAQHDTAFVRAGTGWDESIVGERVALLDHDSGDDWRSLFHEPIAIRDWGSGTWPSAPLGLGERGVRSTLSVSIRTRRGSAPPFGAISAHSTSGRCFSQDDVHFLQAVANVLGAALARAEVEEAEREHRALAEALRDTAEALSSTLDFDELLDRILMNVERVVAHDSASVMLVEGGIGRVVRHRGFKERGLEAWMNGLEIPISAVPEIRRMIDSNEAGIIPDTYSDPHWHRFPETAWIRSYVAAPIRIKGEVAGFLNLDSTIPNFFTHSHARRLQAFADQAAAAMENARLLAATERRLKRITALRAVDMAISGSLDLRVTLNVLLGQVTSQLEVDAAAVLLLNAYTRTLEIGAARGFRSTAITRSSLRVGEGTAGRATLERRLVAVPDLQALGAGFARAHLLSGEDFVSYYGVPLIAKGRVVGVLEIFHRSRIEPDQEWLEFLEVLAGQAAIAIDNARLFEDLQQSNVELGLAYDATIEGWSRALDLRDKETEGHSQRVTDMTVALARRTGISEAEIVHIRRGALLHDIGKMGIPDGILLKPGALSDEEWIIMKQHPAHAYELLAQIAFLRPALDIPYCHHEKWDGSGYPRGLKREQIPLGARIFAVVDVWDALRSDRPYRAAWPAERAREYIRTLAGSHFDPGVVDQFLQLLDEA